MSHLNLCSPQCPGDGGEVCSPRGPCGSGLRELQTAFFLFEVKSDHFKMYNSVTFSPFAVLCNRHLCLVSKYCHHAAAKPGPASRLPCSPLQPVGCLQRSLRWSPHIPGTPQGVASGSGSFGPSCFPGSSRSGSAGARSCLGPRGLRCTAVARL